MPIWMISSVDQRKSSARQATLVSFSVIFVFAVFGCYILKFLGITVPALIEDRKSVG